MNNLNSNHLRISIIIFSMIGLFFSFYDVNYILDIFDIIFSNTIFWYFILASVIFAFINFKTNTKEVVLIEMALHILSSFIVIFILFFIFFNTSNLKDNVIYNSKIKVVNYEEPYSETYTTSVCNNGKCHTITKTRRIPEQYYIKTFDEDIISINRSEWKKFQNKYHNKYEEKIYRPSQTFLSKAAGEGDIWHIKPTSIRPTSNTHNVVNYIKISANTLEKKSITADKKVYDKILEYPKVYNLGYGKIEFNRILSDNNTSKLYFELNKKLNILLADYGKKRQSNIIIYFTHNKPRKFIEQVEKKWITWKKNDIVIFIDTNNNNDINWVKVIAFTKHSLFKIELRDNLLNMKKLDTNKVYNYIKQQIIIDSKMPNGFKRTSMEEYKYLINEINIPILWWIALLFIIISFNILIAYFTRNNKIK